MSLSAITLPDIINYDAQIFKCAMHSIQKITIQIWRRPLSLLYRVHRETSPTVHRKIDEIEMNIKVSYRLAIFAIIIEILIFEIVLMRAHQEKRFSRSTYSPTQFINIGSRSTTADWELSELLHLIGLYF